MTTIRAAQASVNGIRSLQKNPLRVKSLQEYHASRVDRQIAKVTPTAHSCQRCKHETNVALLPDGIGPWRSRKSRSEEQKKETTPMNESTERSGGD